MTTCQDPFTKPNEPAQLTLKHKTQVLAGGYCVGRLDVAQVVQDAVQGAVQDAVQQVMDDTKVKFDVRANFYTLIAITGVVIFWRGVWTTWYARTQKCQSITAHAVTLAKHELVRAPECKGTGKHDFTCDAEVFNHVLASPLSGMKSTQDLSRLLCLCRPMLS